MLLRQPCNLVYTYTGPVNAVTQRLKYVSHLEAVNTSRSLASDESAAGRLLRRKDLYANNVRCVYRSVSCRDCDYYTVTTCDICTTINLSDTPTESLFYDNKLVWRRNWTQGGTRINATFRSLRVDKQTGQMTECLRFHNSLPCRRSNPGHSLCQ